MSRAAARTVACLALVWAAGCRLGWAAPPTPAKCAAPATTFSYQTQVLELLHVYTGDDGVSHARIDPQSARETTYLGALLRQYPMGDPSNVVIVSGPPDFHIPRHPSPYREIFVLLSGSSTIELSDGTKRELHAGSAVLFEDSTGPGHAGVFGPCGYVALDLQFKPPAAEPVADAAPAAASAAAHAEAHAEAVKHCTAMRGVDLSDHPETPARVTEAAVVKSADDVPEVCQLEGYIAPTIGFRIALPLQAWNGKYLQGGCGGACGTTKLFWCDEPLRRGYACASTDLGHKGSTGDWNWAANDLQTKVDFGFRATHLLSLVGKALTARYFGKDPAPSYYFGCSTGGRQALIEAQSFPWDFDGIIAGSPPLDEIGTGLQLAWTVQANLDAGGKPILTEPVVRLLHDAVVRACDLNDGLADGVIGDPRRCNFRLESLQCKDSAAEGTCLTPAQIEAARKIYSGPVDTAGRPVGTTGGAMLGSELYWLGDYLYGNGREPQYASFITNFMRYAAFDPPAGPTWTLSDLDVVKDSRRYGMNEFLFDATNPDLRRFKSAGGKLIGFQGWADTSVVPMQYVNYYETVTRTMGGAKNTTDFYRFFTVPGMRHCSADGAGGDAIDYLSALEQWVEHGTAPDRLIGANFDWGGPPTRAPVFPLDPGRVRFTRPAYPYPALPVYKGQGDAKRADSFRPSVAPQ